MIDRSSGWCRSERTWHVLALDSSVGSRGGDRGVAVRGLGLPGRQGLRSIDPTPVVYTETFTGSLAPGGYNSHPFIVSVSGTVTMTLVPSTPDSTLQLGFDIGTWDGTNCNLDLRDGFADAVQGYSFAGSAIVANFCARIYDAQNLIPVDSTVTYSMTVTIPSWRGSPAQGLPRHPVSGQTP